MKNEYYVCGIDGGGTKTTAICRNLQGEEIARRVFGPLNLNSIGEEAFRELLNEIVLFLRQTGNCSLHVAVQKLLREFAGKTG